MWCDMTLTFLRHCRLSEFANGYLCCLLLNRPQTKMFRSIYQRISPLLTNNSYRLNCGAARSFCNAIEPQNDRNRFRKENVKVTICGRITKSNVHPETGILNVLIKTTTPDTEFTAQHHVVCPPRLSQRLNQDLLQEGDRVYVDGLIQYRPFTTVENKTRSETAIHALQFHTCHSMPDEVEIGSTGSYDINEVRMFGRVPAVANRTEKYTYLQIATQYFDVKTETNQLKYHSLEIHDEGLQKLASTLDVGALVYVNGHLRSFITETNDGFRKLVTLLVPDKLVPTQGI